MLIHNAVDLPQKQIILVCGIGIVHQTQKADAPLRKQAVDVSFHHLQFPAETGLRFAEDDVKPFLLGGMQHALEGRAAAVCAAVVIINVDFVDFPAVGMGIFRQQGALVLYAVAVVFGGALALVLLR